MRQAELLRLGRRATVPWNGTGGRKPAEMAGGERQAGAYPVLWPPAVVGMESDGNGACEPAVRIGCQCDGRGSQGYAWCGHIPIVSSIWVATAGAYVDALYLMKFQQIRVPV